MATLSKVDIKSKLLYSKQVSTLSAQTTVNIDDDGNDGGDGVGTGRLVEKTGDQNVKCDRFPTHVYVRDVFTTLIDASWPWIFLLFLFFYLGKLAMDISSVSILLSW